MEYLLLFAIFRSLDNFTFTFLGNIVIAAYHACNFQQQLVEK